MTCIQYFGQSYLKLAMDCLWPKQAGDPARNAELRGEAKENISGKVSGEDGPSRIICSGTCTEQGLLGTRFTPPKAPVERKRQF